MATGTGEELKVLGAWASPFLVRVLFALHHKGLSYEYVEVDLAAKSDLLVASNPVHRKVPVLLHRGVPVCESMLIVQYLEDAFPDSAAALLPADPYHRAVARFWAAYVDDKLVSSWVGMYTAKTEEEKAVAAEQTLASMDVLEGALRESKGLWFGGDRVGLVDVALGGLVPGIKASEPATGFRAVDPERTPLLAAWVERFCALDAAKAAMPPVERLVEVGRSKMMAQREAAAAIK